MTDEQAAAILDHLYYLFGRGAVFIRVLYGMKKAVGKWKRNWKQTQNPEYRAELLATIKQGGNIGVILGPVSGGICAIDCDLNDEWELFLAASPDMAGRLRTRSAHGGQVFFLMKPDAVYPNNQAVYPYYVEGRKEHIGELRCGGGGKGAYSVIYGWQNPEVSKCAGGVHYTFEVETPIAPLPEFSSIPWRPNWILPWNGSSRQSDRANHADQGKKDASHPATGQPKKHHFHTEADKPSWEAQMGHVAAEAVDHLEKRIQAYLDKCNPAISGQRGHDTTFRMACALVRGFNLGKAEALKWLRYYNRKCRPPWSGKELEHKVGDAITAPHEKPPGYLLNEAKATKAGQGEEQAPPQNDLFKPSDKWQDVPEWAVPIGGVYHCREREGKWQMYWEEPVPGPEAVFDKRTGRDQDAEPSLKSERAKRADTSKAQPGSQPCGDAPLGGEGGAQDDRFFPSTEWQEAPDWAAVPPGGEYRVNMETNKSEARWDPPVPGPEKVFDRRTNQYQRAGPKTPGPLPDPLSNQPKPQRLYQAGDARGPQQGSTGDGECSPFVDLVTLADEPDQPELDLLGNGYLRRGGGMFVIGPTECGKSSLSVQLTVEWSCALKKAIIKSCGELRVMVIQAEDDRQDGREMARVCRKLNLSPEQIERVRKNTRFVEWCPKGYKYVLNREGEMEREDVESGKELTEFLEAEIQRGGPVDIIIVNPLSAYMDEGVMSQKANRGFFYGWITPFLRRQNCAIVFVHHTPKFRDDAKEQHHYVQLYAGAGDATITNWPRASFFVRPTKQNGLFQFVAGKRGRRIGWENGTRWFKWAEGFILWSEAATMEVEAFTSSKSTRGREQSISAKVLCEVMARLPEWVLRADLIETLHREGFTGTAAGRTIHPDDGYQRHNLDYKGKGRKLQIKWKGIDMSS